MVADKMPRAALRDQQGELRRVQNRLEEMLIVSAISVVLKKKASTQWTIPVRRICRLVKLTSAVCPDVPMTLEK